MSNKVGLGSIVTIKDIEMQEEFVWRIVENNSKEGEISIGCDLAKALLGHAIGDIVTVKATTIYDVEIINLDNTNVRISQPPMVRVPISREPLKRNLYKCYGTRAKDIYEHFCKQYGWDYTQSGRFAPQQRLYAEEVTPEGYSVLFLAHSNWTDTEGGNWKNNITADTIEEKWYRYESYILTNTNIRVVFAKKTWGYQGYIFIGLYEPAGYRVEDDVNGNKYYVRIYKRISDEYVPQTRE